MIKKEKKHFLSLPDWEQLYRCSGKKKKWDKHHDLFSNSTSYLEMRDSIDLGSATGARHICMITFNTKKSPHGARLSSTYSPPLQTQIALWSIASYIYASRYIFLKAGNGMVVNCKWGKNIPLYNIACNGFAKRCINIILKSCNPIIALEKKIGKNSVQEKGSILNMDFQRES